MTRLVGNGVAVMIYPLLLTLLLFLSTCRTDEGVVFIAPDSTSVPLSKSSADCSNNFAVSYAGTKFNQLALLDSPNADESEGLEAASQLLPSAKDVWTLLWRPPVGEENRVDDLALTVDPYGKYILSWTYRNLGDYNQDGVVDIGDITPLAEHFLERVSPQTKEFINPVLEIIDGNDDGRIDIADITPVAYSFFTRADGYEVQLSETAYGPFNTAVFVPLIKNEKADEVMRFNVVLGEIVANIYEIDGKWLRVVPVANDERGVPSSPIRVEVDLASLIPPYPPLPEGLNEEYEQAYLEMNDWLNEKLVEWKPSSYTEMHFIGLHLPLTGPLKYYTDANDDIRFLEMLDDAGVDILSMGIIPLEDLDENMIDRYDRVIEQARERGMQIKVWIRSNIYPLSERQKKVISAVKDVISRWSPEYLAIIHEPKLSERDFIRVLVEEASKKAKRLDPNIKVSATAVNSLRGIDYVDIFAEIPDLDIVGFDIYNRWGLSEDSDGGNIIEEKINLIHSKGKEAWIEEFWLSTQWNRATADPTDMTPGFNHPNRGFWDAKFIKVMTYFAQRNHLIGIEPWFTTYFVLYPDSDNIWVFDDGKQVPTVEYLEQFKQALIEQERTISFWAYKDAISEVRMNAQ